MKKLIVLLVLCSTLVGCAAYQAKMERERYEQERAKLRQAQFEADNTASNQLTQAYRNGGLTKEDYIRGLDPLLERRHANNGPEGTEFLAFWRLQASRWLEGKITEEEFSYSLVVKRNELQARVASQQLQQLQALQAAGMLQPQYQPNILERVGEALQGRPDPLYRSR